MPKKGKIFVISGPSGAGKSTIVKELLKLAPDLVLSISATSRKPRAGEVDGKDYFFLTRSEFERKVKENYFIEWAEVHGNLYGTPKDFVNENLQNGRSVILEIDVQGALKVKETFEDAVLIFIEPPDFEELERRLKSRSTDDEETINLRLQNAIYEMALAKYYNYRIVNKDLKKTIEEIIKIIREEEKK
ncbi:MAG: guanylate kinase [Actinobacteria bacterium]|nr:guanylate kinase [Actinomycetota bacterium]